jgi:hypothetical protein
LEQAAPSGSSARSRASSSGPKRGTASPASTHASAPSTPAPPVPDHRCGDPGRQRLGVQNAAVAHVILGPIQPARSPHVFDAGGNRSLDRLVVRQPFTETTDDIQTHTGNRHSPEQAAEDTYRSPPPTSRKPPNASPWKRDATSRNTIRIVGLSGVARVFGYGHSRQGRRAGGNVRGRSA